MIKLGQTVTDSITGFTGIATSRTEYLYGCVRIGVQPKELNDGKPVQEEYFDEQRLTSRSTVPVGGPGDVPPQREIPKRWWGGKQ